MAEPPPTYLDNGSTTMMPQEVIDAVVKWMNRGDPSAEYASAAEARKLLDRFRQEVAAQGGFELEGPRGFQVIFTSGASEGNCHVVTAAARAFAARTKKLPHLVASAVEHKSVLACCLQLARERAAQLTLLPVRTAGADAGTVDPEELRRALRPNTCLVSVMAANHETGAINDLRALGAIAHAAHVPFHTDAAQFYGKSVVRPADLNLDAFTVSFHKLHGPFGVGLLVLRNDFVSGYGLPALICGIQNDGLRGGGENIPAIAGALVAFRRAMTERGAKNAAVGRLRAAIQAALAKRFPAAHLDEYREARPLVPDGDPMTPGGARVAAAPKTAKGVALAQRLAAAEKEDTPVLVWLGPADRAKALPNTLLFAVARPGFCGQRARAALERRGILVACGDPDRPSHVFEALGVPAELQKGVLRVSLSDDTTRKEAAAFVRQFAEAVVSGDVLAE